MKLFSLREECKIASSVVTQFTQILGDLLALQHSELCKQLKGILRNNGTDTANIDGLDDMLNSSAAANDACENLNSAVKLDRYMQNMHYYVSPKEFLINPVYDDKCYTEQYVPILQTLQGLLKHKDVLAKVLNGQTSSDYVLRDICYGSKVNTRPFFSSDQKHYKSFSIMMNLLSSVHWDQK